MIARVGFTSPLPVQETIVILHHPRKFAVPATIVPLDLHNSQLFADWDLEEWELLHKLEWYRRPFVRDLLHRQQSGPEKTFLLLTRLANFRQLLSDCLEQNPSSTEIAPPVQAQAALTVEILADGSTTIYNIETAPWNKFGPERRLISLPAAALFFFAAQHHLACAGSGKKFILSYPTDDGVTFYQKKLQLKLRWSHGLNRYAVVERNSLTEALLSYQDSLKRLEQTLPHLTNPGQNNR